MFNEEITVLKREQAKPKNFLLKLLVFLNRDKNNQQKLPRCSIVAYKCITFRGIQMMDQDTLNRSEKVLSKGYNVRNLILKEFERLKCKEQLSYM